MNFWQKLTIKIVALVSLGMFLIPILSPTMAIDKADGFCDSTGNGADSPHPQVDTALGCIPVDMGEFIQWFLPYLFGITGGISFLLMVYAFILMTTSGGDPKKVQGAKETLTSAISGLLLSIFSLFLLKLIAIDILKIPGIN
ncbi:hypothetical protein DRH14_01425 [Candidatus Shapirobacteria bacterium]|nr:MAG: hypothetical protein DRH14_01425 [Candidatus Shapirobacteria bacterium]